MTGLVSIIIPTYKGSSSIAGAIESVLRQTYTCCEVIVVDDNPPESEERSATKAIVSNYVNSYANVYYLEHSRNMNGAAARNTGLCASSGDYVCFLDDDDIYLPKRIMACVAALEGRPDACSIFCDVVHVYDFKGHANLYRMADIINPETILLNEAAIGTGSNLFLRAGVARNLGGFDERFLRHQDLEFCIRALKSGPALTLHEILIVKGFNGVSNVPSYAKLAETKALYNSCFSGLIDELRPMLREEYLRSCAMSLYRSALISGESVVAWHHLCDAISHGERFGLKKRAQLKLCKLGIYGWLESKRHRAATVSNGTNAEACCVDEISYYQELASFARTLAFSASFRKDKV